MQIPFIIILCAIYYTQAHLGDTGVWFQTTAVKRIILLLLEGLAFNLAKTASEA